MVLGGTWAAFANSPICMAILQRELLTKDNLHLPVYWKVKEFFPAQILELRFRTGDFGDQDFREGYCAIFMLLWRKLGFSARHPSNPVWGANTFAGEFDSHAFPPSFSSPSGQSRVPDPSSPAGL